MSLTLEDEMRLIYNILNFPFYNIFEINWVLFEFLGF